MPAVEPKEKRRWQLLLHPKSEIERERARPPKHWTEALLKHHLHRCWDDREHAKHYVAIWRHRLCEAHIKSDGAQGKSGEGIQGPFQFTS
jgi:hypothetical protein